MPNTQDLNRSREFFEINKMRRELGIRELISKPVKCLRCNEIFISWDVVNNRICPSCSELNDIQADCIVIHYDADNPENIASDWLTKEFFECLEDEDSITPAKEGDNGSTC